MPAHPMRKPPNEQSTLAVMYLAGKKARAGGRLIPRAIVDFCFVVNLLKWRVQREMAWQRSMW
jgi:hypothetical protein